MTNERYLKIVTDLTVQLPVTSERKWASFQVTRHTQLVGWVDRRLFHSDSATVSQCDNFCCYMYLLCLKLYMTSQRWRVFFFFFFFFFGGGGALISSVFSLVFGVVYWSRPPRVLRRFTALLLSGWLFNAAQTRHCTYCYGCLQIPVSREHRRPVEADGTGLEGDCRTCQHK